MDESMHQLTDGWMLHFLVPLVNWFVRGYYQRWRPPDVVIHTHARIEGSQA
jgi:hypothetical protein